MKELSFSYYSIEGTYLIVREKADPFWYAQAKSRAFWGQYKRTNR